jgi:glycosyltransferase involved in cell wall biosynthesis
VGDRARLEKEVDRLRADLSRDRQQLAVLDALTQGILRSRSWRLTSPLRALRHVLAPHGLSQRNLVPWQQLERIDGRDNWVALGPDPQFVIPCWLPAGWVRVRLRMCSNNRGRAELYVDTGAGFTAASRVERVEVGELGVARDFFIRLDEPARAVRFDPLDVEGEFHIAELRLDPVPEPRALVHALRGKLALIRSVGRVRICLWNALGMLLRGEVGTFRDKLLQGLTRPEQYGHRRLQGSLDYEAWRLARQLTDADRAALRAEATALEHAPRLSVLLPVFNIEPRYLRAAIESVRRQTYPCWELCIADDGSTVPEVRAVLEEYARADPHIKVTFRDHNGGIAAASNTALALATGEYVALLDHDDELAEHALSRVAREIVADRDLDMLYSDEDKLDAEGRHFAPFFKPDWSPEYFLACMYTCHLGAYRTSLVRDLGGFRSAYDFAQDYDLALRVVARTQRIAHIPDVLYHWRALPSSTAAAGAAKPQAHDAARRAVQNHLVETGRHGTVEPGPVPGFHRARFTIVGRPRVSIIIPTAGREARIRGQATTFVANCLESIRRLSTYTNYEILVVDNDDIPDGLLSQLDKCGAVRIPYTEPFNLSAKMNLGAAKASGDQLVFLNDDVEVLEPDWLEAMLEYAQQPEIGAVGARLLFPDGRVQHAGVVVVDGDPIHQEYGEPRDGLGYFCGAVVPRNCTAVTGACLMTRAEVFHGLGGFSEAFPLNYNDMDFCLRVRESGRRIVFTPYAELYHYEAASKAGIFPPELDAFKARWQQKLPPDPYYNPNRR